MIAHHRISTWSIRGSRRWFKSKPAQSRGKRPRKGAAIGQEGCLAHLRERLNHGERAQRFEPLERILRSRP